MQIVIDIPEEIEEYIKDYIPIGAGDSVFCYPDEIVRMIQNGTPIPDNATNGNVVKSIFTNTLDNFCERTTWEWNRWWNSPYQKGGKE